MPSWRISDTLICSHLLSIYSLATPVKFSLIKKIMAYLTHFSSHFYTPLKRQKTIGDG